MAKKRKFKKKNKGISTAVVVFGAGVAVVAMGGLFYWSTQDASANAVDATTLCPAGTGPVAMTAILLDLTDPLSTAQHSQLMSWLDKEIDDAPRGTQFTVGVVSEDQVNWGATDPLCKPQDAANAMTQNVRHVEERYRARFLAPLKSQIESMVTASGANRSPIMESLQALVADSAGFVTFTGPRQIIMVTDLLQHSDVLTFYGSRPDSWDSFRASPQYQRLGMTLEDADIMIYQVPRPNEGIQNPAQLEDFWLSYFERQGAHAPRVRRLGDL